MPNRPNIQSILFTGLFATIGAAPLSASQIESQKTFGPWSVVSERDLGEDGEPAYLTFMSQNSDLNENDLGNTIHLEWSTDSKTIRLFFSVFHCDGQGTLANNSADLELREWLAPTAKASEAMFRQRLAGMFKNAKAQFDANRQYHKKQCTLRDIESRFKMSKLDKAWAEFLSTVKTYSAAKGGAK
jgi:hypothetical protein